MRKKKRIINLVQNHSLKIVLMNENKDCTFDKSLLEVPPTIVSLIVGRSKCQVYLVR